MIDAAREVIAENGVSALRVADLTEAVDVGRGSFYSHFASLDELIEAIVADMLQSLGQAVISAPPEEDPIIAASDADRRGIRLAYDHPELARLMVNLDHSGEVFASAMIPYARLAVQRGIDAGRFRIPNLEVALIMLTGGAIALIRAILDDRVPADADMAHAEAVLIAYGIPAPEARSTSRRPL